MNIIPQKTLLNDFTQANGFLIHPDLISSYILLATPLLMFIISFIASGWNRPRLSYVNNFIGFVWVIFVISKLALGIIEVFTVLFSSSF